MNAAPPIHRRQALLLLSALPALGLFACLRRGNPFVESRRHLDAAKVLGRAWLETGAEPPTAESMARLVLGTASLDALDADRTRELLRTRVREDFATGRTARLGGWMLSRAELEVYAFVTLNV